MDSRKLPVISSEKYSEDLRNIVQYGVDTFGSEKALQFHKNIQTMVDDLESNYLIYPECRFLRTRSKMYRNIIIESYLILYRIARDRIEVLRAFHSSTASGKKIRAARKIKI